MKRKKKIIVATCGIAVSVAIMICVFLLSHVDPISVGSAGRPESTEFRMMQDDLDTTKYIAAADQFIMDWQSSHELPRKHWKKPQIVVEKEEAVDIYFAKKEPVSMDGGSLVVAQEKPSMVGVTVKKEDLACQFLPLR
jgi:apolipoprotein N-acyltransferase